MSWKGFTKAVSRLPHTLASKTGIRDGSTDPEFAELHTKFTASEKNTSVLVLEVCKFRDSITALLNHQAEFGIVLAELYDPSIGALPEEVTPRRTQTAPESIRAVDDFQAVMREMRDLLLPEVDKLQHSVIRPLEDMQNLMKMVRKTITKREHKLVDFDRHRISLKKLQDKKERSLSDEKNIYKLESQLEIATADYEGLNNLLKEEIPGFFYYRTQMIEPIFYGLYYLQLRVYTILLDRIEPLAKTGYYDLTMDVLRGYEARKGDTQPAVESVELITRRSSLPGASGGYQSKYAKQHAASEAGGDPNAAPGAPYARTPTAPYARTPPATNAPAYGAKPTGYTSPGMATATKPWQTGTPPSVSSPPPPAYSSANSKLYPNAASPPPGTSAVHQHLNSITANAAAAASSAATASMMNSAKASIVGKRPPPPVPKRLGAKMAVALYDYDAQQEGDLSFRKDDRIEIVDRPASTEDWWTGKLNGRQGLFPGNYVQEI